MKFIDNEVFTGTHAWQALDIAEIEGATVRLHWTDKPYTWHTNDGEEVFVVLSGAIDMHYRIDEKIYIKHMLAGQICHAAVGDEHVAHPVGEARILVVEKKDSI